MCIDLRCAQTSKYLERRGTQFFRREASFSAETIAYKEIKFTEDITQAIYISDNIKTMLLIVYKFATLSSN